MKKIIFKNGTIAGLITIVWFVVAKFAGGIATSGYGEVIGYASMIIALSFVYVGVKQIRDSQDGVISFGRAFIYGLMISLVACFFYVVGWMILDADNTFIEQYSVNAISQLQESGASAEKIAETEAEMDYYRELYANPISKAGITLTEILPVGILVSLIVAAILRKKQAAVA